MSTIKRFSAVAMFLLLAMTMTGCLFGRKHSALNPAWQPSSQVALLPLASEDIEGPRMPTNKLVRITNKVLDTLAAGKTHQLIGPSKVASQFDNISELHHLVEPFNPSAIYTDQAASNHLASWGRSLGINKVVRTRISFWSNTAAGEPDIAQGFLLMGGMGFGWAGQVQVDMELIELSPAHFIRKASGRSYYDGVAGLALIMVPVYEQRTVGRAVDNACRDAMHRLFEADNQTKQAKGN